jgi:hypothetical protein
VEACRIHLIEDREHSFTDLIGGQVNMITHSIVELRRPGSLAGFNLLLRQPDDFVWRPLPKEALLEDPGSPFWRVSGEITLPARLLCFGSPIRRFPQARDDSAAGALLS